jgi:hypothetical protein
MELDLLDHRLVVSASDGARETLGLERISVAAFTKAAMDLLGGMGLPVRIWPVSVETPAAVKLLEDTADATYVKEQAGRFFDVLSRIERVLTRSRGSFLGKASPVHFFWGGFDLAVTRFSGRPAPPREGPAFMREAYSHEVISHGFWPGSPPVLEPAFYAYAVPEPAGLKEAAVEPAAAYYHKELGEFVLPYEAVRSSADPERAIRLFVDSTYERAATLAGWDRAALESGKTL